MFRNGPPAKSRATTWLNQAVCSISPLPISFSRVTRLSQRSLGTKGSRLVIALWPICALFAHEAEGLMRPINTHDAMLCGCGRRMVSNVWRYQMWTTL